MDILISKKRKSLLIPPNRKVESLIGHARKVRFKGEQYLEVPHRRDETLLLRNLGYNVPAPVLFHYNWPGQDPFDTQRKTAAMLTMQRRAYVLNQFGTGKTRSTLYSADFLRQEGDITGVLVVAPLSTLRVVWHAEAFLNFPGFKSAVLHGTAKRRLQLLDSPEFNFFVINPDALGIVVDALQERMDINLIVLDELTAFRNASTDRFKLANKIVTGRDFVWGLTGAPTPNAPTDAWAQCKLVTPESIPRWYRDFRDRTMLKVSQFKWVPRREANDIVFNCMQPAVRFTRAESFKDRDPVVSYIAPDLSKAQTKFLNDVKDKYKTQYKNHEITAANEGIKTNKLCQISCGYVYDNNKNVLDLMPKDRLEACKELIEEADGKTIIFVPFRHAVRQVAEWLEQHYTVGLIYGEVTPKVRDRIFNGFQKSEHPQVLVAHPRTMSHGLTLTAASTIVWYSPTSLETYMQANARIMRESQKYVPAMVHIASTEIERRLFKRLENNESTQGVLLDMFKEVTDEKSAA